MDDPTIARRRLLTGAGAAAGGAVVAGLTMSSPVHADNRSSRVEGSWLAKRIDPTDGVERTFVITFGRGGVSTSTDIHPLFVDGAGAWKARGRHLRATLWYGLAGEPEVSPDITFKVEAEATVHGDTFAGTFTYTIFLEGTEDAIGDGGGDWSATRITA